MEHFQAAFGGWGGDFSKWARGVKKAQGVRRVGLVVAQARKLVFRLPEYGFESAFAIHRAV